MHNDEFHYVQTDKYDGLERRQHNRHSVTEVAEITYNDRSEYCKIQNLSHGGCRLISKSKFNPHGLLTISFLKEGTYDKFEKCLPLHGRVIGVHSSKSHKYYHYNIDFKGTLFQEHGVDKLIESYQTQGETNEG